MRGSVVSIQVSATAKGSMGNVEEVLAIEGKGLEGDRYCDQIGSYSHNPGPDREVTLIELEAIEALKKDYGTDLAIKDSRRNIATRGVPLNHLIDRQFAIGEVQLKGIRLCEPCANLVSLTRKDVLRGLIHRGGLRATIIKGGTIHVGDPINWGQD